MNQPFVSYELYSRFFEPRPEELTGLARRFWKDQKVSSHNETLRILSAGYGSGRLDLPFVLALAEQRPSLKAIEVYAVEPMWSRKADGGWLAAADALLKRAKFRKDQQRRLRWRSPDLALGP